MDLKDMDYEELERKVAECDDLEPEKVSDYSVPIQKLIKKIQDDARLASMRENARIKVPYRRPYPKIGRNDFCPCGSGIKFKKCCGRNNG